METIFKQIQDSIEKYAKVIAEIVDNQLVNTFKFEQEKVIRTLRLVSAIIEEREEGVLVLNSKGFISYANCSAFKILNIDENAIGNFKVDYEYTGRVLMDKTEYRLIFGDKAFKLFGVIKKLENEELGKQIICIFNESESYIEQIDKLTGTEDFIVFDNLLGYSEEILDLKNKILNIAQTNSTVLVAGELGVGKELFARSIHKASHKKDKAFITVNCSLINEALTECEKNGNDKYSVIEKEINEKFIQAKEGTIFLYEVENMPYFMQVGLLKILQELDGRQAKLAVEERFNVRVIASTSKKLHSLVEQGKFREDLYYKLSVIPIEIPPLRKRREDIKVISYYYFNKYSKMFNKKFIGVENGVWEYLYQYDWPGNMRELQNVIEFMVNMLGENGIISIQYIPEIIHEKVKLNKDFVQDESLNLKKVEFETIKRALSIYSSSKKGKQAAADVLGIGIATLYRKIDEYKL